MKRLLGLGLLALLCGCPGQKPEVQGPAPAETETASGQARAVKARASRLFARRDEAEALATSITLYEEAAWLDATDMESRLRLARAYELSARQAPRDTPEARREVARLYETGLRAATEALRLRTRGQPLLEALPSFEAKDARSLYYYSLLLWRWSSARGRATQLARKEEVLAAAKRAADLAPGLLGAAPYRLLGELYAELPPFAGGDLELSRSYFEKAMGLSPGALENRGACARTYALQVDPGLARQLWEEILEADPNRPRELAPENRIEQRLAQEALASLPQEQ